MPVLWRDLQHFTIRLAILCWDSKEASHNLHLEIKFKILLLITEAN